MTATIDEWLPDLKDAFFVSTPFTARLIERNNVILDGGRRVRQNLIYGPVNSGSHATGTPYPGDIRQFMTYMVFNWTELFAALAMDELEEAQNEGAAAVVDYAEALREVAELSLQDSFGGQIFGTTVPPTITSDLQPLLAGLLAYNSGGTYGGLTADTSAQGKALAPNVTNRINTVGGLFNWPMLQNTFGACSYGQRKPDLIVTTEALYDKMVNHAVPAQRFRNEDLKKHFGAEGISYNGADIMVDQKCPSGYVFVLNTGQWKLVINRNRNFVRRSQLYGLDRFPTTNDSLWQDQIVVMCQLVNTGPRYSGYISSVT